MGIRTKRGKLEYRFRLFGRRVQELTDLADTPSNRKKVAQLEAAHRERIRTEVFSGRQHADQIPFTEASTMFLANCEANYTKTSSIARLRGSFTSALVFFAGTAVRDIDSAGIERYKQWRLTEHKVRPVTVRHDLHALSLFFQWAVRQRYAVENPIEQVPIPSDADAVRQTILTAEEEDAYFKAAKGTLYDVARIILNQGMRPDEVLSVRKEDVSLPTGTLVVSTSKTRAGKGRRLWLTEEVRQILTRRLKTPGPWVFPRPNRPSAHIQKVNGSHDRVIEALTTAEPGRRPICDRRWVLYDLRHTFATRMKELGVDDFALAAILGHASTRTLPRYVHPTQHHQDAAMERYAATLKPPKKGDRPHGKPDPDQLGQSDV
jgi:integrase